MELYRIDVYDWKQLYHVAVDVYSIAVEIKKSLKIIFNSLATALI